MTLHWDCREAEPAVQVAIPPTLGCVAFAKNQFRGSIRISPREGAETMNQGLGPELTRRFS